MFQSYSFKGMEKKTATNQTPKHEGLFGPKGDELLSHHGATIACSFVPNTFDGNEAKAAFLGGWKFRGDSSFATYGNYAVCAQDSALGALFKVAVREKLLAEVDRSSFLERDPEPHQRLVKEKDYIRAFSHALVRDMVQHFCFPTRTTFAEGLREEEGKLKGRGGVGLERLARLSNLRVLELELGLQPVLPSRANTDVEDFEKLFEERMSGALAFQKLLGHLEQSGMTTPFIRRMMGENFPKTGEELQDFQSYAWILEELRGNSEG